MSIYVGGTVICKLWLMLRAHSLIHQTFHEQLLCARSSAKFWVRKGKGDTTPVLGSYQYSGGNSLPGDKWRVKSKDRVKGSMSREGTTHCAEITFPSCAENHPGINIFWAIKYLFSSLWVSFAVLSFQWNEELSFCAKTYPYVRERGEGRGTLASCLPRD